MVPKKMRIRLEKEKYLTRRKGLARSDIWRDRICFYAAVGVCLEWIKIRPKVCICDTDDMGVQIAHMALWQHAHAEIMIKPI